MADIIIYDFEIFKYDTLLGALIIKSDKTISLLQTWNEEEMKLFYENNKNNFFIGWNNFEYDDIIYDSIINKKSAYLTSKSIINSQKDKYLGFNNFKCNLKMYSFDLMKLFDKKVSLKVTELLIGKKIHTTDVNFNIDRPLTNEEKKSEEIYNYDDLKQTEYNLYAFIDRFKLRLDIIKEYNLNMYECLKLPTSELAARVLGAKYEPALEYAYVKPVLYDNLQIKNQQVIDYYMNELYKTDRILPLHICGIDFILSKSALHSAKNKFQADKFMYFDVSGFYNLIMIMFDLLPRSIPEKGKKLYKEMYFEQLALKETNPVRREMLKVILLKVCGCMISEIKNPFRDVHRGQLVPVVGQLFIIDLLEKLDGLVEVINLNTDGFGLIPFNWNDEEKILNIVNEWVKRTGLTIKHEIKYNLWQRDVNCYCCVNGKGEIEFKGDALKNYDISMKNYAKGNLFNCKEPPIIAQGIVNYLINDIKPEDFVEQNKQNLLLFQYICKKGTFDYITLETLDISCGLQVKSDVLQDVNRAFAYNNKNVLCTIYQHKTKNNKKIRKKLANIPDNIFIYNDELKDSYEKLKDIIDYQYYVERIYKKIGEFVINQEDNEILKYLIN